MELLSWIIAACAANVCVISLFLVFHQQYEDGFWGRLSLAMIGTAAGIRVLKIAACGFAFPYFSSPALLIWAGLTIFLWRHLTIFLKNKHFPRNQKEPK